MSRSSLSPSKKLTALAVFRRMIFNLDDLLHSKKNFVRNFSDVSGFHTDASHSEVFVSAAGRVKASSPAVSNKTFSFIWGE